MGSPKVFLYLTEADLWVTAVNQKNYLGLFMCYENFQKRGAARHLLEEVTITIL